MMDKHTPTAAAADSARHHSDGMIASAHNGVEQLAASSHGAIDSLANGAGDLADLLSRKGGQLQDSQRRLSESCRNQIREKPLLALGIAVASGFLLSWLVRARHG